MFRVLCLISISICTATLPDIVSAKDNDLRNLQALDLDWEALEGTHTDLVLDDMIAVTEHRIIASGGYYPGPLASGIYRSDDAGGAWSGPYACVRGATISYLRCVGEKNVYGLALSGNEGATTITHVVASSDAGITWQVTPSVLPEIEGIHRVVMFRMFDVNHGLLHLENSSGRNALLWTKMLVRPGFLSAQLSD